MKVSELKTLAPIADVCELQPNVRYIVALKEEIPDAIMRRLYETLRIAEINAVIVDPNLKFHVIDDAAEQTRKATAIVEALIDDLSDRRGLRHEWDQIDEDIQKEIVETWKKLVAPHL